MAGDGCAPGPGGCPGPAWCRRPHRGPGGHPVRSSGRWSPDYYSRPALVIRSVTVAELSLAGSTLGACRSFSGTRAGLDGTSEPTAYSKDVPFWGTSWPALPVMNFSSDWAAAEFFDDLSTPPPET